MAVKLTKNAQNILEKRYLQKDELGRPIESAEDLFRRVAQNIALADALYSSPKKVTSIKKKYNAEIYDCLDTPEVLELAEEKSVKRSAEEFYALLSSLDFLPNSPTLLNAGRKLQQLSACFVLPIHDSTDSIFKTLHHAALIHKTGAGTGFNFSHLRPRGDVIESAGFTTGPVSFMKVYDAATNEIKLGGVLRGANMGILNADHPNIKEFLEVKGKQRTLTNFNISVGITDEIMQKYTHDESFAIRNPRTKEEIAKMSSRELLQIMSHEAWATGDPGVIFLDRIERDNPTPLLGVLESTDSCGEQPLLPYESCVLGSINLAHMVKGKTIDYAKMKKTIHLAIHFLDNVIDMCRYPIAQNREIVMQTRKIGLGVMGFADMLIALGTPYDSKKAEKRAEELMKFIRDEARMASCALAKERGTFPAWNQSTYNKKSPHFRGKHLELRNATLTTIAPTGTISIIAGCSAGIEPLFALSYARRTAEGATLYHFNEQLKRALEKKKQFTDEIKERIAKDGTLKHLPSIAENIKSIFVTANDISSQWHVRIQAAFQKNVDNGISKTVTLPNHATPKDIEEVYLLAYELGCKGVSVYRSGSLEGQVIYLSTKRDEQITLADWV